MATDGSEYMTGTSKEAADIAKDVHDFLFEKLHTRFPFMKADAVTRMVNNIAASTRGQIEEQEQAIAATKAAFDFFLIPAELRNRIYEDVLFQYINEHHPCKSIGCIRQHEIIVRGNINEVGDFQDAFHWPTLLCVNKQIRKEALPIYLSNAKFVAEFALNDRNTRLVDAEFSLKSWLRSLGSENSKFIKKLVLRFLQEDTECLTTFLSARYKKPVALNKQTLIKALRVGKYGVAHEAFEVQFDVEVSETALSLWDESPAGRFLC